MVRRGKKARSKKANKTTSPTSSSNAPDEQPPPDTREAVHPGPTAASYSAPRGAFPMLHPSIPLQQQIQFMGGRDYSNGIGGAERYGGADSELMRFLLSQLSTIDQQNNSPGAERIHYVAPKTLTPGRIQGKSPSGTMIVHPVELTCQGYCPTSFQITYELNGGVQKVYNESPGRLYQNSMRLAFLPCTDAGEKVLARLKFAWLHGLTFSIGTSVSTGLKNVIVWATIPHKTCVNGGQFGYPDPDYFYSVNESLDALGVPDADECETSEYVVVD